MTDDEKAFDLLQKMGNPEVTFQDLLNFNDLLLNKECDYIINDELYHYTPPLSITEEEPIVKKNLVSTEQRRMWRKIGGINV